MKLYLECIPCILRQALDTARLVTDNEQLQRRALQAALQAISRTSWEGTPLTVAKHVHRAVREALDCPDPYAEIKRLHDRQALELYPRLQQVVAEADDSLRTAVKIAMAGNIMDLGVSNSFDVEATLQRVLQSSFAIDHFAQFREAVNRARRVLYLADNAGEIVFDRVLLSQLGEREITVAVKSEPFINDAMRSDALEAGIDELAEIITVPPAADISAFGAAWTEADLIVLKGQANYEAYSAATGPIYFLLLAKCDFVAQEAGVNKGDMILQAGVS